MTREELAGCGGGGGLSGGGSGRDHQLVKPTNVFYVWYAELCRRAGMQPLNHVKPAKPKNENVLDFVADRLKVEEWTPVINALRLDTSLHVVAIRSRTKCKFLQEIDTEEKVKQMKRRAGSLYTAYVSRSLVKSLCNLIRKSNVLSKLELDGLPLGVEDVEVLVEALQKNNVLKWLSLKYCQIRDLGCQLLCNALRQMPNIEVLNLTSCGLGPLSAQYIARVVKVQQINRYCESWHNSLRYEDPDVEVMAGLRRITLNSNPQIGDEGLTFILDELDDDLWIKALDMQRCGVTENIGKRLLDVIESSRSLEIADFRNNELHQSTIDHIFELLKQKRNYENSECEFKWCLTTSTLRSTVQDTQSRSSIFYPPGKSKSVPIKNSANMTPLRRTKTASIICNNTTSVQPMERCNRNIIIPPVGSKQPENNLQRSYSCLNTELQRETMKRIQSEKENKRLKHELEKIKSMSTATSITIVPCSKDRVIKFDPAPRRKSKNEKVNKKLKREKDRIQSNNHFVPGSTVKFVFEKKEVASNILEDLVTKKKKAKEITDESVEYFKDIMEECDDERMIIDHGENNDSQTSLINFIHDIKSAANDMNKKAWTEATQGFLQKVH